MTVSGKGVARCSAPEDWVLRSRRVHRKLFGELDVLLRSLDRWVTGRGAVKAQEGLSGRNFLFDLVAVRDTVLRTISVLEVVIPDEKKNLYWFQKFAETELEAGGGTFRDSLYCQETPGSGLYLLFDSLMHLKNLLGDLLQFDCVSSSGFQNAGAMVTKVIRENVFFNPFRRGPSPDFDRIDNAVVSSVVKSIPAKDEKKQLSVIFLHLFRILRFLGSVEITSVRPVSLHASVLILSALRSEIQGFRNILEKAGRKLTRPDLTMLCASLAYQFSMETKRVYLQELRSASDKRPLSEIRVRVENSHGILRNLTEQAVVQLVQFYQPTVSGEEIFPRFKTLRTLSLTLRNDILVLHRITKLLEAAGGGGSALPGVFESVRTYMVYFESHTFRLLRYGDYEEFARFFEEIRRAVRGPLTGSERSVVRDTAQQFRVFLEAILSQIGNRGELVNEPVDRERIETLFRRFVRGVDPGLINPEQGAGAAGPGERDTAAEPAPPARLPADTRLQEG